ncbi:MAG: glycine cleavage system protein R [Bacterioplanes sp.]|nr:glycine cleavage system protein R [Bacterioplanes sp.]
MSVTLVLTIVADDKPGIVESIATVVAHEGGNWLESRMAQMAGKFAGIVRVDIAAAQQDNLLTELAALRRLGILIHAESCQMTDTRTRKQDFSVSVVGNDRPGIVKDVSQVMAQSGVNVLEFISNCDSAEMSATALFKAEAHCQAPDTFDIHALREQLESLSNDLMVDIHSV